MYGRRPSLLCKVHTWFLGHFDQPTIEVSPHLMKHVRGLAQYEFSRGPVYLDLTRSMIRNKDCVIEEIDFHPNLLANAELLDETLRNVRSFKLKFEHVTHADRTAFVLLARSFKRTKADGNKLERVSVIVPEASMAVQRMVQTILCSRPNLQVLNLQTMPWEDFVPL